MSNVILSSTAISLIMAATDLGLRDEPGLSVGQPDCEPCKPFGGRMSNSDAAALMSNFAPEGVSVGQADGGAPGDNIVNLIRMLGGTPCRIWGEPVPGNCCNSQGGIDPGRAYNKLCGAIVHYDVEITAANQIFELKPNRWFLPLLWQDVSQANTVVAGVTYEGKPFGAAPDAPIYPAQQYPMTIHNPILGYPACSNQQPISFRLQDASGTYAGGAYFRGKFIGIAFQS